MLSLDGLLEVLNAIKASNPELGELEVMHSFNHVCSAEVVIVGNEAHIELNYPGNKKAG